MKEFIHFLSLSDVNVRYVVIGAVLLNINTALLGTFAFTCKRSLVSDAIAHSVLPGICMAFLCMGTKNTLVLTGAAFASGLVAMMVIDYLPRITFLKEDTVIALVLSVMFGIGILLLTIIQHTGNANQVGLDSFIFGKAAVLIWQDLVELSVLSVCVSLVCLLFFKEFSLIVFDYTTARAMGIPVRFLGSLLTCLTVLTIVIGIHTVGILLISSMLIAPHAAARYWINNNFVKTILVAMFISLVSSIIGSFISYSVPQMPTGPCVVLIVSGLAYGSFIFAPNGIIVRWIKRKNHINKIRVENMLKIFYALGKTNKNWYQERSLNELLGHRHILCMEHILKNMVSNGYVQKHSQNKTWSLTPLGKQRGSEVAYLHLIWEEYLQKHLNIQPDHVHEDAESMEHVISPALKEVIKKELQDRDTLK